MHGSNRDERLLIAIIVAFAGCYGLARATLALSNGVELASWPGLVLAVEPWFGPALKWVGLAGIVAGFCRPLGNSQSQRTWGNAAVLCAGACVCAGLFMAPVVALWTNPGHSPETQVGGLLPAHDAQRYYSGAMNLIVHGELDSFGSRRPLNGVAIATRLLLAGGDYRLAMLLQAGGVGLAAWMFAWTIVRACGWPAGLLALGLVYSTAAEYSGLLVSEPLGLMLGLAAAGLLVRASSAILTPGQFEDFPRFTMGVASLTLALCARAGAFFSLPTLLAWGTQFGRATGLAILIGIIAGSAWNFGVLKVFGTSSGVGQASFAVTLYGIVKGTTDSHLFDQDFPEAASLSEEDRSKKAFDEARAFFREQPWQAAVGYGLGARASGPKLLALIERICNLGQREVTLGFAVLCIGVLVRWIWMTATTRLTSLVLAHAVGVLASIPLIVPESGPRVLVASLPLLIAGVPLAFTTVRRSLQRSIAMPGEPSINEPWPAMLMTAMGILLTFGGPVAAERFFSRQGLVGVEDDTQAVTMTAIVGPMSPAVYLSENAASRSFAPRLTSDVVAKIVQESTTSENPEQPLKLLGENRLLVVLTNLEGERCTTGFVDLPHDVPLEQNQLINLQGEQKPAFLDRPSVFVVTAWKTAQLPVPAEEVDSARPDELSAEGGGLPVDLEQPGMVPLEGLDPPGEATIAGSVVPIAHQTQGLGTGTNEESAGFGPEALTTDENPVDTEMIMVTPGSNLVGDEEPSVLDPAFAFQAGEISIGGPTAGSVSDASEWETANEIAVSVAAPDSPEAAEQAADAQLPVNAPAAAVVADEDAPADATQPDVAAE